MGPRTFEEMVLKEIVKRYVILGFFFFNFILIKVLLNSVTGDVNEMMMLEISDNERVSKSLKNLLGTNCLLTR